MQLYDTFNNKTIPTDETRCYFQRGGVYKSVRITVSRSRKRISTTWHYNEKKSVLENWADLINTAKAFEIDPIAFEKERESSKIKRVTVQELYPHYLESEKTKDNITNGGIKERQGFYDRMLLPFFKDYSAKHRYFRYMEVAEIDKKLLQDFVNFLCNPSEIKRITGIPAEKYKHATVVKYFNYLNAFRNYAVKQDILPYCLTKKDIDFPKNRDVKEVDAFSAEDLKSFFSKLDKDPLVSINWKAFFHLVLETGCRTIEIRALTWDDIDFNQLLVNVNTGIEQQEDGSYIEKTTKTGIIQQKAISTYTADLLKKLKIENETFIRKHQPLIKDTGNWVFITTNCPKVGKVTLGAPWDRHTPTKKLKKLLVRYGLPKHTMHSFRRTAGTFVAITMNDYESAQHLLGHKSLQTTIDSYVRSTESVNRDYVEQINKIISTGEENEETDNN